MVAALFWQYFQHYCNLLQNFLISTDLKHFTSDFFSKQNKQLPFLKNKIEPVSFSRAARNRF